MSTEDHLGGAILLPQSRAGAEASAVQPRVMQARQGKAAGLFSSQRSNRWLRGEPSGGRTARRLLSTLSVAGTGATRSRLRRVALHPQFALSGTECPDAIRIGPAHEGTVLGVAVIFAAGEVVNMRPDVHPHHSIAAAVRFRLGFGRKLAGHRIRLPPWLQSSARWRQRLPSRLRVVAR